MTKLKIGLVFDDSLDKPDGVQQFVFTIGRWLTKQGHDVHYLVGETKRTDIPNVHSLSRNMKVRFNQNRMAMPLPANKKAIRELLAQEQFDVLHVQVPYSPFLAGRIINAADDRTAVIGTFHVAPHSGFVSFANRLLALWVHKSLKRFDLIMSNSTASQSFAKKTFKMDMPIMPLPLELDPFYSAQPFARYVQSVNVMFLGRFVQRKGCQYLLQAIAQIRADGAWPEGARVVLCGTGPLQDELQDYTALQKMDDIVEFTGYVTEEDKPRFLAGADVVVYPSTGGESFGIVLLEAMAASRGVVLAGNNPGYASVMAPRPESLFEPLDTKTLAEKILTMLVSKKDRDDARQWQREYVKQFDINQVGPQIVDVYTEALHKRRT